VSYSALGAGVVKGKVVVVGGDVAPTDITPVASAGRKAWLGAVPGMAVLLLPAAATTTVPRARAAVVALV
jgi:hypothetical protein